MSAKVAIVFGGSRGIGGAVGSRLAQDGFDVALTYVSRPDRAGDLVSAIEDIGRRAIAKASGPDGVIEVSDSLPAILHSLAFFTPSAKIFPGGV